MVANRLVFISCHLSNLSDKAPTCLCLFIIEIMKETFCSAFVHHYLKKLIAFVLKYKVILLNRHD